MSGANLIDDQAGTSLPGLAAWVHDVAELTKPDDVVWCDGSEDEWERLTSLLVENGTFMRLKSAAAPEQLLVRLRPFEPVSGSCIGTSSTASG
jgi:phosphoenolpyruvate carboxykinase (GTP)